MIFSKNLLKQYLPQIVNVTNEQLINACSCVGLELEKIYHHPLLNNLVIGKLKSFKKHPNADSLSICEVVVNAQGKTQTIVTGAPGLIAGKNVVVALEGAKLHDGRVIVYKELRGIMSQGMLCSYEELTPYNHAYMTKLDSIGIMQFDDGVVGDTNVATFLGLDDVLYDIAVPFSNRNDINGLLSFCQEISGYFKWNFSYPKPKKLPKISAKPSIPIKFNANGCLGLSLVYLQNVDVSESPWSVKKVLINNQIKPINKVIDQLSMITLLTNVPSGAYDADKVKSFNIDYANGSQKISSINGSNYTCGTKDLVIKSGDDVICLAGIVGSNNFAVTETTKNVLVEFANFDYHIIRDSAKKFNINTEAAKKFSKPIALFSSASSYQMVFEKFATKNIKWTYSSYNSLKPTIIKDIDYKFINELLGTDLKMSSVKSALNYFGFKFKEKNIIPPQYRTELVNSYDIAEEILKSINVNEISEQPVNFSSIDEKTYTEYYFYKKLRKLLYTNYFSEVKTYNTCSANSLDLCNIFEYKKNVSIVSSNNENRQNLRNNLLHAMLGVYKYNLQLKNDLIPIFEIQKIYQTDADVGTLNLTCMTPASYIIDGANNSKISFNLNGINSLLSSICQVFNIDSLTIESFNNSKVFNSNECLAIKNGSTLIGYMGSIRKSVLNNFDIGEKIFCLSINLNTLIKNYIPYLIQYKAPSAFQTLYKDITINYDGRKNIQKLINSIDVLNYVSEVKCLYHYVDKEKNTYTFRIYFEHNANIQKDEINKYMDEINKLISN